MVLAIVAVNAMKRLFSLRFAHQLAIITSVQVFVGAVYRDHLAGVTRYTAFVLSAVR